MSQHTNPYEPSRLSDIKRPNPQFARSQLAEALLRAEDLQARLTAATAARDAAEARAVAAEKALAAFMKKIDMGGFTEDAKIAIDKYMAERTFPAKDKPEATQ